MAGKKRVPLTPVKHKAIVVGVTDLRELQRTPAPSLPANEVTIRLHHGGTTLAPTTVKQMPGPRLAARFETVLPATAYRATAYRRTGSALVATALPKQVVLGRLQAQAEVDLELHHAPELTLLEARFEADHEVLTEDPDRHDYHQPRLHRTIMSFWGEGSGHKLKPEYSMSPDNNPPGKKNTRWHPASYTMAQTAKLRLKLRASVPDKRPHALQEVRLIGGPAPLTFHAASASKLVDGEIIELQMEAAASLPSHVDNVQGQLVLAATADDHPVVVMRRSHWVEVLITLGKPAGRARMHAKHGKGELYPEDGPTQSITPTRLRYAVSGAKGTSAHEEAVRKLFDFLRKRGIGYFPFHRYPTIDEKQDDKRPNTTGLRPLPRLHEYLWIAMAEQHICHCLDLAGGFRLLARAIGTRGGMDVKQCFPWPPWDDEGNRRDLDKDGEPWQGSLRKYPIPDGSKLVFIDGSNTPNNFEAVLRYQPPGSAQRILLPIGERILDAHGPGVKPGPMDDRNASLFFQVSATDRRHGLYRLAVKKAEDPNDPDKATGYRKPPFPFMAHPEQVIFRFHYSIDTMEPGDEHTP